MAAPAQLQYSVAEKVDILLAYVSAQKDAQLASMLYAAQHPGRRVPARATFVSIFNRFRTTGSVHAQRRKRPASATEDFDIDVLAYVAVRPEASVREIASADGASPASVWRSLSRHSYHPYHVCLHQELRPSDFQKRLDFCNWCLIQCDEDREFLNRVLWTDEAQFCRNSNVNLHNAHYWSDQNPHWLREHKHQVRWSVNVWCGIYNGCIVGPYFIDGNLTGKKYTECVLKGVVSEFASELPLAALKKMWFQHDGAPPHFSSLARKFVDESFPNQWIGRGGTTPWPPRSPDLSPLDFFLWGYVKNEVFKTEPANLEDMKQRVRSSIDNIPRQMILSTMNSMKERLRLCIAMDGKQFEHIM